MTDFWNLQGAETSADMAHKPVGPAPKIATVSCG